MRLRRMARVVLQMALVLGGALPAFAGFSGTDVFIPSVGRGGGAAGSQWYTTLWIHNPSEATAKIDIYFLERNVANPSPPVAHDSIGAMQTRRYANVMADLFRLDKFGALRVVSSVPLILNARVYNLPSGGEDRDTRGQFYAGVPASFAIGSGQLTSLLGVYQTSPKPDSQFRYNFGWVETSGGNATVRAMIFREDGTWIETKDYPVTGPYEARLYPVEDLLPGVDAANLRIALEVIAGTGKIIATGSGVANRSNDGSTFEMSYREELLTGGSSAGLDSVAHDATLIGNGTISSPLGIADGGVTGGTIAVGAVTPAKINFSDAKVGQVLKFDGSAVGWANDDAGGLTLPYSNTAYSTGDLFAITNTSGNVGALAGAHGVAGQTSQSGKSGVYGYSADGNGWGVFGRSVGGTYGYLGGTWQGVYGYSPYSGGGAGVLGEGSVDGMGVYGKASGDWGTGVLGINTTFGNQGGLGAVIVDQAGRRIPVGVFGRKSPNDLPAHQKLAAYFDGWVWVVESLNVGGAVYKSSGSFKIDHPLDPANKYLFHSFVESPDMMNVYNGNVVLDGNGEARIELPEWFEALNRDFRYQLTAIGAPGPNLFVAERITGNRFKIGGGSPGLEVSWQVTGIRQDAWANAHRIPVEENKPEAEQGRYIHPELFGQPDERRVGAVFLSPPEMDPPLRGR